MLFGSEGLFISIAPVFALSFSFPLLQHHSAFHMWPKIVSTHCILERRAKNSDVESSTALSC